MAYTAGEYIEKFLVPQLINEIRNMKADFMTQIPTVPQRAVSKAGIVTHKVGNPIVVDWNKVTDYVDVDVKKYQIENEVIPWENFSTSPFEVDKEEARTSMVNRESSLFMHSREAITESFFKRALHALAPADGTVPEMPLFKTTGDARPDGSLRLTINDLIGWVEVLNNLGIDISKLYVVLNTAHLTDLQLDAKNHQDFKDIYVNTKNGEPIPQYGLNFFHNRENIHYTSADVKKAQGAAIVGTDRVASIAFYAPHCVKGLYRLESHYSPRSMDTRNNPPVSEGRFTGDAVVSKTYEYGHSALVSG